MDPMSSTYVLWAVALGGLSAVSLPLGSAAGLGLRPSTGFAALLAAFGAGALIAALALAGLFLVAALFVAMVAWQSARPLPLAPALAAVGIAALLPVLWFAGHRRRYFSAALWLALGALLLACYLLLQAAPTDELRQFYEEDPSRHRGVLITVAVLVGVGILSFKWLAGGRDKAAE